MKPGIMFYNYYKTYQEDLNLKQLVYFYILKLCLTKNEP